jgi:hypothetical protein
MVTESLVQGRLIGSEEWDSIRRLLSENPHWSRWRLSRAICELWNWRAPNGQIKDMAARTLLLKLEERGCLELPRKRQTAASRMRQKRLIPIEHATEPVHAPLSELMPLEIQELNQSHPGLPLFDWLLHRYHYLSYVSAVGLNLKYLICDRRGRPLSCLLFGSAAWQCAVRDGFIGWSARARQVHLQEITNNTRFLILPWIQVPGLATQILNLVMARLRQDWQHKYARPLSLVETFVDTSRFTGVCYRAANWIYLGETTGRTRQDRWNRVNAPPKGVFVCPLVPDFGRQLTA